jgi:hypothetical protein
MDRIGKDIKQILETGEFDRTVCKLLIDHLKKDMSDLYIAANTENNQEFHSCYRSAMARVFALGDQIK